MKTSVPREARGVRRSKPAIGERDAAPSRRGKRGLAAADLGLAGWARAEAGREQISRILRPGEGMAPGAIDRPPLQAKCSVCKRAACDDPAHTDPTRDGREPVQAKCSACARATGDHDEPATAHDEAHAVLAHAGSALPYRDLIQQAFGRHDLSGVRAVTGGPARQAGDRLDALAFTSGTTIGFREAPDLRLAAHESAHVIQQRHGLRMADGMGRPGDRWERHADRVAEAVVAGKSAEGLLDEVTATPAAPEPRSIQREAKPSNRSGESKPAFADRVLARAAERLTANIGVLGEWHRYVAAMEGFQLRAQLMAGTLVEHATAAAKSATRRQMFEDEVSTHDAAERQFKGSMNDIEAPYRARANDFMAFLVSKSVTGHFTTPSIAEKAQVLVGDRDASDLPPPRYVPPSPGYEEYADIARRFAEGKAGPCETCHEVVRASGRTFEKYGTSLPDFHFEPIQIPGHPFDTDPFRGASNPFLRGSTGAAPSATELKPFVPQAALPQGVATPAPRTDLCGELPDAEDSHRQLDVASWGPASAIVADVIARVNAVLQPLGPRGYRVLGRQNFDALFKVSPDSMAAVQSGILERIVHKQQAFAKLRSDVQGGEVPYEELCPIVDELLPTTSQLTATLAIQDVQRQQRKERTLMILELVLLALSVMFPPAAIVTIPATAALGLVRVGLGFSQLRQGRQWQQGTGAGIYALQQEAEAPGLAERGRSNIIAGALEVGTSVVPMAKLALQAKSEQALFKLLQSGTYELRHALYPGLVLRAQRGELVLIDTRNGVIVGYGKIQNGQINWISMRIQPSAGGAGASSTTLAPTAPARSPAALVPRAPAVAPRGAIAPVGVAGSTRALVKPSATAGVAAGTAAGAAERGLTGTTLVEAPLEIAGPRHMLRLLDTPQGAVWSVCSSCTPVIDVLTDLRETPGLVAPITERLDAMLATIQKLTSSRNPAVTKQLLRALSEADQLVGHGVLAQGLARGGPPTITGTGTAAQIAARAAELKPVYYKALWESRRQLFRGSAVRDALAKQLDQEAHARAFVEAQSELRGTPLSLAPGAPARLAVDPATDIPFGFFDRGGFEQFSRKLYAAIPGAGRDIELVMGGSGVGGRNFERLVEHAHTGAPFDVGKLSDYDVTIVSDELVAVARQNSIPTVGNPPRTAVLSPRQLRVLGLDQLHGTAQAAALEATGIPHEVHFVLAPRGSAAAPLLPLPR